jgi:hypothetical protein
MSVSRGPTISRIDQRPQQKHHRDADGDSQTCLGPQIGTWETYKGENAEYSRGLQASGGHSKRCVDG